MVKIDRRTVADVSRYLSLDPQMNSESLASKLTSLGVKDVQIHKGKITGRLGNPVIFLLVGAPFRAGRKASPGSITIRFVDVKDGVRAEIHAHYDSGFSLIKVSRLSNVFRGQFNELIAELEK